MVDFLLLKTSKYNRYALIGHRWLLESTLYSKISRKSNSVKSKNIIFFDFAFPVSLASILIPVLLPNPEKAIHMNIFASSWKDNKSQVLHNLSHIPHIPLIRPKRHTKTLNYSKNMF